MNVLDWLLLVLVLAYALSGYWQGFVTGAFATTGLVLGGLLGVWLAPIVLGDANPSLFVSLGALFIVILAASLGQAVLQFSGARVRERITWQPVRALDAVGGAALSAVAVLLVSWALGVAVAGAGLGGVSPMVRNSAVLGLGRRDAPRLGRRRAERLQQRRRDDLLPALPRAVRPRAHRRGRPRPAAPAHRSRRRGRRTGRAQGPGHQRLRARRRGHRLRLLRRPADDQRPRGRRRRRARGDRRRQLGDGGGRLLQLRPGHRGARARHLRAALVGVRPRARSRRTASPSSGIPRTVPTTCSPGGSGPSSGCAPRTSTARAPSSARCSRCADWCGRATPAARSSRRAATWSAWCSRPRSPTATPATPSPPTRSGGVPRSGSRTTTRVATGDCAG